MIITGHDPAFSLGRCSDTCTENLILDLLPVRLLMQRIQLNEIQGELLCEILRHRGFA